jgi:hypothetical protein
VLLELPADSTRALLLTTLATGLGSNPVGLDRGANGPTYVVRFDRSGERVLAVLENWRYRSSDTANAAHGRTVREAFPPSTVAALPLVAVDGRPAARRRHRVPRARLDGRGAHARGHGAGAVRAGERPQRHPPPYTRGFPRNTEIDVTLTFAASGRPGPIVERITPDGRAFTLREHLSLIPLPDGQFRPRELDARVGYFGIRFHDFAQPIQRPLQRGWVSRHRLVRGADGRIANPIVYYVDPGIPEPVKTATMEGVKWWEEAFDKAGLQGGFRVEWLPADADPMDARYNVVQWENRNERGWSIGGSLGDPRTGEILKAMARMDSHRARTDYNLYAGLMGADAAAADTAFVLARVRQVSAHEVGHTLGLGHNYIASTYERGSVMDYPRRACGSAPPARSTSPGVRRGPGRVRRLGDPLGLRHLPAGSEADSLRAIVQEGLRQSFLYLADADARPEYAERSAHQPLGRRGHRRGVLAPPARRAARGDGALRRARRAPRRPARPAARALRPRVLHAPLRPLVAGQGRRRDGVRQRGARRRAAGDAPRAGGAAARRPRRAGERARTGDARRAGHRAHAAWPQRRRRHAAGGAVRRAHGAGLRRARRGAHAGADDRDAVLVRERAARLVQQHAFDPAQLSLSEAIRQLAGATRWGSAAAGAAGGAEPALRRVAQRALFDRLLALAADTAASPEVRAIAELELGELATRARRAAAAGGSVEARATGWPSPATATGGAPAASCRARRRRSSRRRATRSARRDGAAPAWHRRGAGARP